MRRVSDNVSAELLFWGCNPGFLTTSDGIFMIDTPQQPIDAMRWRERLLELGPIRYLVNTEPHGDHVMGNSYFPEAEVIGQRGMLERYEELIPRMTGEERLEAMKQSDPDSVWLLGHPSYPPNPPTRLFDDELTIELGDHTIQILHTPGHTAPQTAVLTPQEGVIFTGDNVFCRVKTFIQEGDPWVWIETLERIRGLDFDVIVPGHGEPCDKSYLDEQSEIIAAWIGAVEDMVDRGLTLEEAIEQRPPVDPYAIGQRLFAGQDRLNGRIIANLYPRVIARQGIVS